jgi:hypothetical protein
MLDLIVAILIICWLLGIGFNIGGSLIHLVLVIAVIVFLYRLLANRTPRI